MNLKIYIDTNVFLDSILNRDDGISSQVLIYLAKTNALIYLNDLSIINIHYIATTSKKLEKNDIDEKVRFILKKYTLVSVDKHIIENSLDSNFKDFEDGVQYFCAKRVESKLIITNNIKDFTASEIMVLTPTDFYNKYIKSLGIES